MHEDEVAKLLDRAAVRAEEERREGLRKAALRGDPVAWAELAALPAPTHASGAQAAWDAQEKAAAKAQAEADTLNDSLFGGPPRNRHERRKLAKLARTGRR